MTANRLLKIVFFQFFLMRKHGTETLTYPFSLPEVVYISDFALSYPLDISCP